MPVPVETAALKIFVAVGAVSPAGKEYTPGTLLVGVTQLRAGWQADAGWVFIVVALVGSLAEPLSNVVEVAVRFQPAPLPRASRMSTVCVWVTVWSVPSSVTAGKLTAFGVPFTNDRLPGLTVPDADASAARAVLGSSAPPTNKGAINSAR